MLVYPILCKFLQTYPGITQDNLVADAARRVPVRPRACHHVCPSACSNTDFLHTKP